MGPDDLVALTLAGFSLAQAVALVPRPDSGRCLLLTGDPDDVATVALGLVDGGWQVLSDRPSPVAWRDQALVAHPRPAPFLASPRSLGGRVGIPVRQGSTSLVVHVPRHLEPAVVGAIAMAGRRRPGEARVEAAEGLEKFTRTSTLMIGGVLDPHPAERPVADVVAEHSRLAALPAISLRLDGTDDVAVIASLQEWWARQ